MQLTLDFIRNDNCEYDKALLDVIINSLKLNIQDNIFIIGDTYSKSMNDKSLITIIIHKGKNPYAYIKIGLNISVLKYVNNTNPPKIIFSFPNEDFIDFIKRSYVMIHTVINTQITNKTKKEDET